MTPKRAVLLALSSVVLAAQAQDAGTAKPGPLDAACKQDLEAFCGSVQPGEGRMINCLVDHEKELSNTCRRRMDDLRTHGAECKDDIEKFCPSTPRAKGRLAKCLHDHHDELSEDCKALSTAFKGSAKAPEAAAPAAAAAAGAAAAPADAGTADAGPAKPAPDAGPAKAAPDAGAPAKK